MTDYRARLGEQRTAGEQKRHRHRWDQRMPKTATTPEGWPACRCGAIKDEAKSRKGRSARSRGNRRELEIARQLGGEKVGMYGGPIDVQTEMFAIQSKVRRSFPNWQWDELAKLPRTGGRIPLLVVTDAPGVGKERRSIVVMTFQDFCDLHGVVNDDVE